MIFHDVEQNTAAWHQLRLGIPCSSDFSKIVTPKKREISKSAMPFMFRLLAEWMTGEPVENAEYQTEWMERGQELEDQAVRAYEGLMEVETTRGGFCTDDAGLIGCSPDRLIGEAGDLEIKAPLIHTQIGYALTGDLGEEYMTQLQGRLMITGRKYVDIFSFHPKLIIPAIRVPRDEEFISDLKRALDVFVKIMLEKRTELEQRFGPFVRPEAEKPVDYPEFLSHADGEAILAAQRGEHGQPATQ